MFFENVKRLTFSVDKCKSLNINARKEEKPTLDINGSTVENAKEFMYLGDYLNEKGNNDRMIDDRIKKGEGKVYVIQAFCEEVAFGLYEVQILLQLYESIFLSYSTASRGHQ